MEENNVRILREQILKKAEPQIRRQIRSITRKDFNSKKEKFFQDFENHEVTKEIEAGPTLEHSNFVNSSQGNLFSLLGFTAGHDPIGALRNFLKKSIKLGDPRPGVRKGGKLVYETPVQLPTLSEIDEAMNGDDQASINGWDERSFTQLLRKGIPGLPHYLFSLVRKFSHSFSGTAIQTSTNLRGGSVGPIKYIDELLASLKTRIGKVNKVR